MRLLPFVLLAAVTLVLQVTLAPAIALTSAQFAPQLLLISAMFIALWARAESAMIGCWTLGLLLDLASGGPMGAFAFSFGLVGLGIVAVRASLFRDHLFSHILLALVFGLLSNTVASLVDAVHSGNWSLNLLLIQPLAVAFYTAMAAPYMMLLLNRFRRFMHFPERT